MNIALLVTCGQPAGGAGRVAIVLDAPKQGFCQPIFQWWRAAACSGGLPLRRDGGWEIYFERGDYRLSVSVSVPMASDGQELCHSVLENRTKWCGSGCLPGCFYRFYRRRIFTVIPAAVTKSWLLLLWRRQQR
jgi:hypothetical protein